jgi:MFS family permease
MRVQGFVIAGSSLGAAISPLAFTWLLNRFAWRTPFFLAALAPALLSLLWYGLRFDNHPRENRVAHAPKPRAASTLWLALITNCSLMLLTIAYGTLGYFQYILSSGCITAWDKRFI